jgi:SAM-dependent methyltransferase
MEKVLVSSAGRPAGGTPDAAASASAGGRTAPRITQVQRMKTALLGVRGTDAAIVSAAARPGQREPPHPAQSALTPPGPIRYTVGPARRGAAAPPQAIARRSVVIPRLIPPLFRARPAVRPAAPVRKRYLSDRPRQDAAFLQAAKEYVARIPPCGAEYLYRKPFPNPYEEIYDALNLLRAMDVPPGGRFLEVGSGPGWLTEFLVGMGYAVEAVEPCPDMIAIARQRVADFRRSRRLGDEPPVAFHCTTLEECDLPDACCDAVVFFQSLHHVLDEDCCLAQCTRLLKPEGVLGVSGEPAWLPGHQKSEAFWEEEMRRWGALENPFTREYLEERLRAHGFNDVVWYHGINGLFPEGSARLTVPQAAQRPASALNTVTARKTGCRWTTADLGRDTRAEIAVPEASFDPAGATARLRVRLANRGETAWTRTPGAVGAVTLSLHQGRARGWRRLLGFREAEPRLLLPRAVRPGDGLEMEAEFHLPAGRPGGAWKLDLVSEHCFWFSERGTRPAVVHF